MAYPSGYGSFHIVLYWTAIYRESTDTLVQGKKQTADGCEEIRSYPNLNFILESKEYKVGMSAWYFRGCRPFDMIWLTKAT